MLLVLAFDLLQGLFHGLHFEAALSNRLRHGVVETELFHRHRVLIEEAHISAKI